MKTKWSNKIDGKPFEPFKEKRTPKGGYYQGQSSSAYWRQRSKERLSETFEKADALKRYEEKFYEEELRKVVDEYKELIKPYLIDGELKSQQITADLGYEMRRLLSEIDGFTQQLSSAQSERLEQLLEDIYISTGKSIIADLGLEQSLYLFDKVAVQQAIHTPWTRDGREFSDRIWQNTEALNRNIRYTITEAIARGEAPNRTIKEFKRLFGNSSFNTARLVLTESSAIQNQASINTYKEAGVEYYEVIGSSADGLCSPCIGKKIRVAEAKVGVNCPVFHPFAVAPSFPW